FHPEVGNHTSKFTAGLTTPATRQASTATLSGAGFDWMGVGRGDHSPAGISVADAIVVSGSDMDRRLSQVAASMEREAAATRSAVSMAAHHTQNATTKLTKKTTKHRKTLRLN